MESRYLSTADASRALGVSVSTVKRWVDDGILPAHKTAGGHRKLLLSDLLRLGRAGRLPNLDVRRVELLSVQEIPRDVAALREEARRVLKSGEMGAIRSLLLGGYQSGVPIDQLFDEVVLPALSHVDEGLVPGQSHRRQQARQECKAALYELKAVLELRACQNCPAAIGGALWGDQDLTFSLLIQLVLIEAAWEPINLGPHTPIASFYDAVNEVRPKLLWVTVSQPLQDEEIIEEYNRLYKHASEAGVSVLLHGPGLTEHQRRRMSYTSYADRMAHVSAFARTLHPPTPLPRRGRPTSSFSGS